jgi:catechol 2,3-dioxygenase-like lactoylglutathione lyase family enzyme
MAETGPFYHAAFVVRDLEQSMDDYSAALGLSWARVLRRTALVQTAAGVITSQQAVTYSLQGPPYLELFQVQPEPSPWSKLGMHHIGTWAEDVKQQLDRLTALGFVRESAGVDEYGRVVGFEYLTDPSGNRIEVLHRPTKQPMLERWLAGGDYQ